MILMAMLIGGGLGFFVGALVVAMLHGGKH